jgi:phosphatidylserine/phosphatidylglycerophosphate/cardiolipin synthase-like enzyme
VIRRTMATERNFRPWFSVNPRQAGEVFRAAFDAFCLRWNLYGMQNDEPLLLKLAVNITPFGTMTHIPSYWSLDPKRDIRWDAISAVHSTVRSGHMSFA